MKVESNSFWQIEADRLGISLVAVKQMGDLYDIHACGDPAMGRLRHCVYFEKPMWFDTTEGTMHGKKINHCSSE